MIDLPPLHRPEFLDQYGSLVTPLLPPPLPKSRVKPLLVALAVVVVVAIVWVAT